MAKFYIVGHRGASAYQPENTIVSLNEAIARRADMVEFDLRRTADGVIVLFHDREIRTQSGRRKPISRIKFSELTEIAATRGYQMARFDEILKLFGRRIALNIEIKAGGFESEIVKLLCKYPPAFEPTLSSFFPRVLGKLKRTDLRTALILGHERIRRFNILARPVVRGIVSRLGISSIHLQEEIATRRMVDSLIHSGISVFVWTVDDPERMRKFLIMGVDGIITNKPDLLFQVCSEMARGRVPLLRRIRNKAGKFAYIQ